MDNYLKLLKTYQSMPWYNNRANNSKYIIELINNINYFRLFKRAAIAGPPPAHKDAIPISLF